MVSRALKLFLTLSYRWVTVQHYLVYSLVILGDPKYIHEKLKMK